MSTASIRYLQHQKLSDISHIMYPGIKKAVITLDSIFNPSLMQNEMMKHYLLLICISTVLPFSSCHVSSANQSEFFTQMKKSLQGDALSSWVSATYCNYSGIGCSIEGFVTLIDISMWSLAGKFPENICYYLPKLRVMRLGHNRLSGRFPANNCSFIEELDMTFTDFDGELPDFSFMKSLKILKFPNSQFTGRFPMSVFSLSNLEEIEINEVVGFDWWELPENFTSLEKLKVCILTTCKLQGHIPPSIGNLTSLTDLELSGNFFKGKVPRELGMLKNLHRLELYYNQLSGSIPPEIGNITKLIDLDMSANILTGQIPESICGLPKLKVLQLYQNDISGNIPIVIGNSTTMVFLSLYGNFLTGEVPQNLGEWSPYVGIELSENHLSGKLPAAVCKGGKLMYLLLLENKFSGSIPESYSKCITLLRFRLSHNHLEGSVPEKLFALPHAFIFDLAYNHLHGNIPKEVAFATNLSELFLQRNMFTGSIPSEISRAQNLVKIDLSHNLLSSAIPSEIVNLKKLNILMLHGNTLSSSIPTSLSSMRSLNLVDLSDNLLTGTIPERLGDLLPNSINLTNNQLNGPIPRQFIKQGLLDIFTGNAGLCVSMSLGVSGSKFPPCSANYTQKKVTSTWSIVISAAVIVVAGALLIERCYHKIAMHLSVSYDVRNFCRNSLDPVILLEGIQDSNIIGHGGSGTVYKVTTSNAKAVAIKKLNKNNIDSLSFSCWDKQTKAEVMTLGGIRHTNVIKLYCLLSTTDSHLLVYEYMENGNLWDALHSGNIHWSWNMRYQIALGIAQGLAYLHHDLIPPIIHRDIKSSNILLDADYRPKLADFGIAKVAWKLDPDSTTSGIAGTYGYLAPEYAYSSTATTKCDVYSFGVVLMELVTGRRVVEEAFGESSSIVDWVSCNCNANTASKAMGVLDEQLATSFSEAMFQVLQIAICCTNKSPTLRPNMKQVLDCLLHIKP